MSWGNKKSFNRGMKNKFLSIDFLGEPITFNIHGRNTYRTCFGSMLVTLILIVTMTYASIKFGDMMNYADTNHQYTVKKIEGQDITADGNDLKLDWVFAIEGFDMQDDTIIPIDQVLEARAQIHRLEVNETITDDIELYICDGDEVLQKFEGEEHTSFTYYKRLMRKN